MSQPELLSLGYAGAVSILIVIELVRFSRLPPLGQSIHHFMTSFTDEKEEVGFITLI
jgi:hypothetical protein